MNYFQCEMCQQPRSSKNPNAVMCKPCTTDYNGAFEKEQEALAAKWAAGHKCRRCGVGLSLDRYFNCHDCDVPSLRETEDEWDDSDDLDVDGRREFTDKVARYVEPKVAVAKTCRRCMITKEPSEYQKHPSMKDGLLKDCKACRAGIERARQARLREERKAL